MSKELKAPDKVTQKMTRDGAIAENLTTGETTSISERPPEENYSAPAAGAAEKATQRISTEVSRHLEKGAEKKSLDAAQLKTHTSRLQFSAEERATPELQKAIRKSDKAADRLDAARAAIQPPAFVAYARSGNFAITSAQRGQRPSAFAAVECFQQRGHFVPAASSAEAFTPSPTVTST